MAPSPSALAGRASRRTTCSPGKRSSAASSIVTIRSWLGRHAARLFSSVVFPLPVPPVTSMFAPREDGAGEARSATADEQNSSSASVRAPKRRIVRHGPSIATGGTTAFTREPSGRRASTSGRDRSTRKPSGATTRSMRCATVPSSSRRSVRESMPSRSIHTPVDAFTMTSVIVGSASSDSRGPSPAVRAETWRTIVSSSPAPSNGASRRTSSTIAARVSGASPARAPSSSRWCTRASTSTVGVMPLASARARAIGAAAS